KTVVEGAVFLHENLSVSGNWVEIRRNGPKAIGFWGSVGC
ncbi:MAG: hypothetical protein AEth_01235, partial [Candidatus Argoarchaeum ethanivorans]